uniref:Peptidase aspartic putative domain-containing protein n=1 Tax=Anopheles epiroticus TaxID=199890 RepID=A0A182PWX1_9DIPT
TKACGFTNIENLTRLIDCLEGPALEAVRSRLVLPDSVPGVIEDLRHLFGRPGKLLKNLLKQVKDTPSPKADDLESFIPFSIKNAYEDMNPNIIFRMIPVTLSYREKSVDILAFVDEGSTATLLNETVARKLQATEGIAEPLIISWTNEINRTKNASRRVELMVSARGSTAKFPINTRTVSQLILPNQNRKFAELIQRYSHLRGLPVDYDQQLTPQMIVGLDNNHGLVYLENQLALNRF